MLWNSKFELGIPSIDEQHKRLIELIEQGQSLTKDLDDGIDCYDEIIGLLNELDAYTVYHFEYEEKLMEAAGYKETVEHFEKHSNFVDRIHDILDGELDREQSDTLQEIIDFLLAWVSEHILIEDVQYVEVVKGFNEDGVKSVY